MTATRRIQRVVENVARNFVRKCKRRGVQVWWVNNCGNIGRQVWAMRGQFTRGLGFYGADLDVERATFWIPRQYDNAGDLLFPVTLNDGSQDISIASRIWYNNKLYEVDGVSGDVEGISETAVFTCQAFYRMYNPLVGDWTPPSGDFGMTGPLVWHRIHEDTTAEKSNGYFIDASANAVTLTLPSAPSIGWQIGVRCIDITNTVTIAGSGGLFIEGADDLVMDISRSSITLTFSQETGGWLVTDEV